MIVDLLRVVIPGVGQQVNQPKIVYYIYYRRKTNQREMGRYAGQALWAKAKRIFVFEPPREQQQEQERENDVDSAGRSK